MASDLLKYRDKHKDYYGDMSLDDVARDVFESGGHQDNHPDFETWANKNGFDRDILEDKIRRKIGISPIKSEEKKVADTSDPWITGTAKSIAASVPGFLKGAVGGTVRAIEEMSLKSLAEAPKRIMDLPFQALEAMGVSKENADAARGITEALSPFKTRNPLSEAPGLKGKMPTAKALEFQPIREVEKAAGLKDFGAGEAISWKLGEIEKEWTPVSEEGSAKYHTWGAIQSAVPVIGLMAAGVLTKNPQIVLDTFFAQGMGDQYIKMREKGFTPEESLGPSLLVGYSAKATESLPFSILRGKNLPFWKKVVDFFPAEVGTEIVDYFVGAMTDKATTDPNMTLGDLGRGLRDTIIQTAIGGGLQVAAVHPIVRHVENQQIISIKEDLDSKDFSSRASVADVYKMKDDISAFMEGRPKGTNLPEISKRLDSVLAEKGVDVEVTKAYLELNTLNKAMKDGTATVKDEARISEINEQFKKDKVVLATPQNYKQAILEKWEPTHIAVSGVVMTRKGAEESIQKQAKAEQDSIMLKNRLFNVVSNGMEYGLVAGEKFGQEDVVDLISRSHERGILSDEDLDVFGRSYPALKNGIIGIRAKAITAKIQDKIDRDDAISEILTERKTGETVVGEAAPKEEIKIVSSVVRVGDGLFEAQTHPQAINKAVESGALTYDEEKKVYSSKNGEPFNYLEDAGLFKTDKGDIVTRKEAEKITGGYSTAETIDNKHGIPYKTPSEITVDDSDLKPQEAPKPTPEAKGIETAVGKAEVAKEPWQMTKDEYLELTLPDWKLLPKGSKQRAIERLNLEGEDVGVGTIAGTGTRLGYTKNKFELSSVPNKEGRAELRRAGYKPDKTKKIWTTDLRPTHEMAVRKAIFEGKQVSKKVLDEYPDLVKPPEAPGATISGKVEGKAEIKEKKEGEQTNVKEEKVQGKAKEQKPAAGRAGEEGKEVKAAKPTKPFKAKTLISWVKSQGGIWDESLKGETNQFIGKESGVIGLLSKGKGKPFDELAALAKDYGWIGPDATAKDFIDLLGKDVVAAKQRKERVKSLTQDIEKGVLREIEADELEIGEAADELMAAGWKVFGTNHEEKVGNIDPGDRVLMNGEEYVHIGFTKGGKAILKDGETFKLDAFDKIPIEAMKEGQPPKVKEQLAMFGEASKKEKAVKIEPKKPGIEEPESLDLFKKGEVKKEPWRMNQEEWKNYKKGFKNEDLAPLIKDRELKTENAIFKIIQENPNISYPDMEKMAGIEPGRIGGATSRLKEKGLIKKTEAKMGPGGLAPSRYEAVDAPLEKPEFGKPESKKPKQAGFDFSGQTSLFENADEYNAAIEEAHPGLLEEISLHFKEDLGIKSHDLKDAIEAFKSIGNQLSFDFSAIPVPGSPGKVLPGGILPTTESRAYKVIGHGFAEDLIQYGAANYTGQVIEKPSDLALLAQVFRNPKFETFRIFFTKGNKIVGHEGITSRLPGEVAITPEKDPVKSKKYMKEQVFPRMKFKMARLGADGFWIVHNHPSGQVNASPEDLLAHQDFDEGLMDKRGNLRFKGGIIINGGKYGLLQRRVEASDGLFGVGFTEHDLPGAGPDALLRPSIDHPLIGINISSPETLATLSSELKSDPGMVTIVYLSIKNHVRAIQEVPIGLFNNYKGMVNYFRGRLREFGSVNVAPVFAADQKIPDNIKENVKKGIHSGHILDAAQIGAEKTARMNDAELMQAPTPGFFSKEQAKSYRVAETTDLYHGSPHVFDRFQLDKIGTGEGVQAFGWGLYFTDQKAIAAHYANALSGKGLVFDGVEYDNYEDFREGIDEKYFKNLPIDVKELPEGYEVGHDSSQSSDQKYHILPPGQVHARPFYGRHPSIKEATDQAINEINRLNEYRKDKITDHIWFNFKSGWLADDIIKEMQRSKFYSKEEMDVAKDIAEGVERPNLSSGTWEVAIPGGLRSYNKLSREDQNLLFDMNSRIGYLADKLTSEEARKYLVDTLTETIKAQKSNIEGYRENNKKYPERKYVKLGGEMGDWSSAIKTSQDIINDRQRQLDMIDEFKLEFKRPREGKRNLYNVTLHKGKEPGAYDYLNWYEMFTPAQKEKLLTFMKENAFNDKSRDWEGYIRSHAVQDVYRALADSDEVKRISGLNRWVNPRGDKTASLFLLKAGIDGIKYPTETLSGGKGKGFNYVVFDENAVTVEEHERYSVAKKQQEKNLAIVHNLTINNLRHALKMGGLPVPSTAVIDVEKSDFTNFGEITLIASPDRLGPGVGKENKYFNADAYSPRYPRVSYFLTDKSRKVLNDWLGPLWKEIPKAKDNQGGITSHYVLEENIKDDGIAVAFEHQPSILQYAFLKDEGKLPENIDTSWESKTALREAIESIGKEKYEAWSEKKIKELGIEADEKIFNGFDYSGNKKYLKHNLDTVVRLLKKEMKEGEGFDYGVPSIRAKGAEKFRTVKQIQKNRDKIITSEEMDKIKEEVNNEFLEIANETIGYLKYKRGFGDLDSFSSHVKESIEDHNFSKVFGDNSEYYESGVDVNSIREFVNKLRNLPTEYFEGKIQRAVGIHEFERAVVPDNTPQDLIDQLKTRGVEVVTYKKGDEADRKLKVKEASEAGGLKFSAQGPQTVRPGNTDYPSLKIAQEFYKDKGIVTQNADGTLTVKFPNGHALTVKEVEHISDNEIAMKVGYSRQRANDEVIAGSYKDGTVKLVKNVANKWVVSHENFHFLEDFGLITPGESAMLENHIKNLVKAGKFETVNKAKIGGAEDRANFMGDQLTGTNPSANGFLRKIVARIREFVDRLVNAFGKRTVRGITRDVETGEIYNREGSKVQGEVEAMSLEEKQGDTKYLKAVEAGDMDTAQKMVDEAAKRAGYTIGPVWHGSPNLEYNKNWTKAVIDIHKVLLPNEKELNNDVSVFDKDQTENNAFWGFQRFLSANYNQLIDKIPENLRRIYSRGQSIPFTSFDLSKRGESTEARDAKRGFFFTRNEPFAYKFQSSYSIDTLTGAVKKIKGPGSLYRVFLRPGNVLDATKERSAEKSKDIQKYADISGYDTVINKVHWQPKVGKTRVTEEIMVTNPSQIKYADPVTYDDKGNVIPLSQRFNKETPDIRFTFAGQKATGADLGKLARATEMSKEGKSATDIWDETGWVRAKDGKWRFEIDDSKAKMLIKEGMGVSRLGDFFDHPDLFNQYPDLKNIWIAIDINPEIKNPSGNFNTFKVDVNENIKAGDKRIVVDAPDVESAKSVVLHEIQHFVQEKEGFSRGGSPENAPVVDMEKLSAIRTEINQLNIDPYQIMNKKAGGTPLQKYEIERFKKWEELTAKEDEILSQRLQPYKAYRNLAGEAEAREVQNRMGWSAEQRAIIPPSWDGIDENDLIVRMEGGRDGAMATTPGEGGEAKYIVKQEDYREQRGEHGIFHKAWVIADSTTGKRVSQLRFTSEEAANNYLKNQNDEDDQTSYSVLRSRTDLNQAKVDEEIEVYKKWSLSGFSAIAKDMYENRDKALIAKAKEQGITLPTERPDFKRIQMAIGSPEFFTKVPQFAKLVGYRMEQADIKEGLFNDLTQDKNGRDLLVGWRNLEKDNQAEFTKLGKFLIRADQKKQVYNSALVKGLGFSDQAVAAWEDARQTMRNGFELLIANYRDIVSRAREQGLPMPVVVVKDPETGKPKEISIKTAIAIMGDMERWYWPRIRESGQWAIVAKATPEMEARGIHSEIVFRDRKIFADRLASEYRQQGFNVDTPKKSEGMSEDLFAIWGKTMATEQMVNEAHQRMMKELDNKTDFQLTDMGIKSSWGTSADGKPDFTVDTRAVPQELMDKLVPILKSLGGNWYAAQKDKPKFWHFVGADKGIENKIRRALSRYDTTRWAIHEEFDRALAMNIANIEQARGFRSSMIQRGPEVGVKVWEGSETNPLIILTKYSRRLAAGEAKKITLLKMIKTLNGTETSWQEYQNNNPEAEYKDYIDFVEEQRISPTKQKVAYGAAIDYIQDTSRNQEPVDRAVATIKGVANFKYLAFRVAAPIVNWTALITSGPAAMNGYAGIPLHSVPKYLVKGVDLWWKYRHPDTWGELPAATQAAFKIMQHKNWVDSQYNQEAMAVMKTRVGRGWERIIDWGMWMFGITEQQNRTAIIMGTFSSLAEKEGLLGKKSLTPEQTARVTELMDIAHHVSDRANGVYGPATNPMPAQGKDIGAQVIKSFYMFKKFQHNYLQTLYELGWKQGNWKAATYMFAAPTLLAGAGAFPIPWAREAMVAVFKYLFGSDDPEEEFYSFMERSFGEFVGGVARQGIVGMAGMDFRGSFSTKVDIPTDLFGLLGAPGSVMNDIYQGSVNILKSNVWKGTEKILPRAAGTVMQGIREATEGVTTKTGAPVFQGGEQIKGNLLDAVLRSGSFNPARLQRMKDIERSEKLVEIKYRELRTAINSKYLKYFLRSPEDRDKIDLIDLADLVYEYNMRVRSHDLLGIEPMITGTSVRTYLRRNMKPTKKEIRREQRRTE